jgi:hypothetical protein
LDKAQHVLLNDLNPNTYDIAAIQEPYMDFLGKTRANPHWRVVYPKKYYTDKQKKHALLY